MIVFPLVKQSAQKLTLLFASREEHSTHRITVDSLGPFLHASQPCLPSHINVT